MGNELTELAIREPLRRALASRTPRALAALSAGPTTAAGVLVPLFRGETGEVHLWLVRRPTSMRSHAGQVAFPGGKRDLSDDSLRTTALREAEEELGIAPRLVDVLGPLDDVLTTTGFTISPWVGWLEPGLQVAPNRSEVARAFAAPLGAFLSGPSGALSWRGWIVDGELVWGATAMILRGLVSIVKELPGWSGAQ